MHILGCRTARLAAIAVDIFIADAAQGQQLAATNTETVTVIGATPLPGTGIAVDRLPESVETLMVQDLSREGDASVTTALNDQLGSINVNDNLDDPFQPDILYRGFEASPVLGTPEGLAVYQNGVRINEAFGDVINWDLVPDLAVERVDVVSANPLYGLNALGGAVVVTMKNGFDYDGGELEVSGGSWGRREGAAQYGAQDGNFGIYVSARFEAENGWREFSPGRIEQVYGDVSYHTERLTLDASLTAADNIMDGESPSPVQELAVDRALVFTSPQSNRNRVLFSEVAANYSANASFSVQANFFYRVFRQDVMNGNTTNYAACTTPNGLLCQPDGVTPLSDTQSAPIPDISQGGTIPIGENDFEEIATNSFGGALQLTDTDAVFGRDNHFSLGADFNHDATAFGSQAEVGIVNRALQVLPSGFFVVTPEGTPASATPVALEAADRNYGVFATDTMEITRDFAVTASGRYNLSLIGLADERGNALSGNSSYARFNPALGAIEALSGHVTLYAGYAEGNRAPTPGEIECANPTAPCLLPSSLSSDPPTLKQVVSRTFEAGGRGDIPLDVGHLTWRASIYRTDVGDDIYGVATSLSSGFFRNIGGTRRQGGELGIKYTAGALTGFLSYDYVDATFQSVLLLPSPLNTGADANGNIHVMPGDRLPGIPAQRLKAGLDYRVTSHWSVGSVLVVESAQYFRGDESNQMNPLSGFAVVNFHSTYELCENWELFVQIFNLLDAKYADFGELGDPTGVNAPGIPLNPPAVDNRFESPTAPRTFFGGVKFKI